MSDKDKDKHAKDIEEKAQERAAEKRAKEHDDEATNLPQADDEELGAAEGQKGKKDEFIEKLAADAAAQSPGEPQVVPEGRPQTFTQPDPTSMSRTDRRMRDSDPGPATQEDYDRANSDEQKKKAEKSSQTPNLTVGQRVVITDGPDQGRMAFVQQIDYKDQIQGMIANSGNPAFSRFAEVEDYVVRTRDGRSDILTVAPDQVAALDDIGGWGRGTI